MSYRFLSFKNRDQQDLEMWDERTLQGETESCATRTLREIFETYIKPDDEILEAGCGLGGWVNYFWKKGYHITGLEYDKRIIEKAKSFDQKIPIEYGDVNFLRFDNDSFDDYISLGVIEHFEEGPDKALQEAARVLKPGGLAFITVPYHTIFRRLFAHRLRDLFFLLRRIKGGSSYFWEYRYSKRELIGFLKQAGFSIIYVGIDDYIESDHCHHIGLYADFFFLRKKKGEIWELNTAGKILLRAGRIFSPWLFCSGIHIIAQNNKQKETI
jgi:SAM-dependent methyltransferase